MKFDEALEILKEELLNEGDGSVFNAKVFFSKKLPEGLKIVGIREREDAAGNGVFVIKTINENEASGKKYIVFTQCDKTGLHSKHDKLTLEEANKLFENRKYSTKTGCTGGEASCKTDKECSTKTGCTGSEASCKTNCAVEKNANTPEIVAMVVTKLKKAGVDTDVSIKLARPIASTIVSFEKSNSKLGLNEFDAGLYSKLRSDFEKISVLKAKADTVAQKIVDGYHNC